MCENSLKFKYWKLGNKIFFWIVLDFFVVEGRFFSFCSVFLKMMDGLHFTGLFCKPNEKLFSRDYLWDSFGFWSFWIDNSVSVEWPLLHAKWKGVVGWPLLHAKWRGVLPHFKRTIFGIKLVQKLPK